MTATHIDSRIDEEPAEVDRTTEISRSESHDFVGTPVFLTGEDLEKLGIDPKTTSKVIVRVEDGFILLDPSE